MAREISLKNQCQVHNAPLSRTLNHLQQTQLLKQDNQVCAYFLCHCPYFSKQVRPIFD
jgi:hypothetical protein